VMTVTLSRWFIATCRSRNDNSRGEGSNAITRPDAPVRQENNNV